MDIRKTYLNKSGPTSTDSESILKSESDRTIETLVEDVYNLISGRVAPIRGFREDGIRLGKSLYQNILETKVFREESPRAYLRPSKIGLPIRKLWFLLSDPGTNSDINSGIDSEINTDIEIKTESAFKDSDFLKFLYGHMTESLLLSLVRMTGHVVEGIQREVCIYEDKISGENISGSIDCIIDGYLVDIKTCSSNYFSKFSNRGIFKDDPFGYIGQISAYYYGLKREGIPLKGAAFLALNKESGALCLLPIEEVDMVDPVSKILEVKEALKDGSPPVNRCYNPVPQGDSGNLVLGSNCKYCPFKWECWKKDANDGFGLIAYDYKRGPEYFVKVVKEPKVLRLTWD